MDGPKQREFHRDQAFIPTESSTGRFITSDRTAYRRGMDGVIRRLSPKVNGKVARRQRVALRAVRVD